MGSRAQNVRVNRTYISSHGDACVYRRENEITLARVLRALAYPHSVYAARLALVQTSAGTKADPPVLAPNARWRRIYDAGDGATPDSARMAYAMSPTRQLNKAIVRAVRARTGRETWVLNHGFPVELELCQAGSQTQRED